MRKRRRLFFIAAVLAMVAGTIIARRRGYPIGVDTPVRCSQGHVFTTIWIPGVSLKSIRLGWWRFQRCPVGQHWTLVRPVRPADLSVDELASAATHRDVRVP
jgi:hypothetical protein